MMSHNADYEAFIEAQRAHMEAIAPAHELAFSKPAPAAYSVGDTVWLYDHYNTAKVISGPFKALTNYLGVMQEMDHWKVQTLDSDGTVHHFDYDAKWLRPADKEHNFVWHSPER